MKTGKILVADDEKDLREALVTFLTDEGFIVVAAEDGEAALLLALKEKPDLLLLDINMPKMSGHQVLSKLRRDRWGKEVPVLLLTNADDATNISHGVEFKANEYIIKTQISLKEVAKRVKQYLAGYHD